MLADLITPGVLAVIALLVIPAVVGLVNMLKQAGLDTRWAGPVAVTLGLIIMITYGLFGEHKMFVYALVGLGMEIRAACQCQSTSTSHRTLLRSHLKPSLPCRAIPMRNLLNGRRWYLST